jgi:outer membrane receptor protein involved in Fe transport
MKEMGTLDFVLNGTYLQTLKTTAAPGSHGGDDTYDCAGYFGSTCGTPNPTWRHKFRATWSTPWNVQIAGTWRHFNSVKDDQLSSSVLLAGSVSPIQAEFGARDYFDLNASYALTKNITISGGINNLFDKDPPLGAGVNPGKIVPDVVGNGNTFPQVYDALGRKIYLNLSAKF